MISMGVATLLQSAASKSGLIFPILGGVTALFGSLSIIAKVESGEMAIRTRFSKVVLGKDGMPRYVGPGWHLRVPGWGLRIADVRDTPIDLGVREIDRVSEDGTLTKQIVQISATWRIAYKGEDGCIEIKRDYGDNIRRALYNTKNLDESVANSCSSATVQVIDVVTYDELRDLKLVYDRVVNICGPSLTRYGVELLEVLITGKSRSEAEVLAQAVRATTLQDTVRTVAIGS